MVRPVNVTYHRRTNVPCNFTFFDYVCKCICICSTLCRISMSMVFRIKVDGIDRERHVKNIISTVVLYTTLLLLLCVCVCLCIAVDIQSMACRTEACENLMKMGFVAQKTMVSHTETSVHEHNAYYIHDTSLIWLVPVAIDWLRLEYVKSLHSSILNINISFSLMTATFPFTWTKAHTHTRRGSPPFSGCSYLYWAPSVLVI